MMVSDKSRKAIATVHLVATALRNHFTGNKCCACDNDMKEQHELTDGEDTLNADAILSNIFVTGGAPRDYLLNHDINDLDILVDTQALNKLHFNHLNAYHSSLEQQAMNSSCIFWKLYLQKLNSQNEFIHTLNSNQTQISLKPDSRIKIGYMHSPNDDDVKQPEEQSRHVLDANYMLNSKYFTDIISKSKELKESIHITIYAKKTNLFRLNEIEITQNLLYHNLNLKGQSIDFLDAVKRNSNLNIIRKYEDNAKSKTVFYSDTESSGKCVMTVDHNNGNRAIKIEMEIYDVSAMESMLKCDLSLTAV